MSPERLETKLSERSERFRSLHAPGRLLVLPNVWDAASAGLFESLGAEALATSSAAVCWAHGYPDGGAFPRDVLLGAVREIVRVVRVPVSVDVEAGYSDEAERVGELAATIAQAGAVGINLEDGKGAPELLAAKIAAAKSAAPEVFVNARADVFLRQLVPPDRALRETLERIERYAKAGCDGVFVPWVIEPDAIRAIVAATPLPVNVLARADLAPAAELRALGVRRLSVGAGPARAALGAARRAARELLQEGRYEALFKDAVDAAELNALFHRETP